MDLHLIDFICQFPIVLLGITSQTMIAHKNKWGFVVGIFAQPFWYATSLINHQWGIFTLAVIYTVIICRGFYVWFYKTPNKN